MPTRDETPNIIHKPQQHRSLVRYHHILNTAAHMFATQGYENVGSNHIAAAAGVSVGSFYRFFSSKEALVEGLVERYISDLEKQLPDVIEPAWPMTQVVQQMLEKVFEYDRQNASFAQILTTTQYGQLALAAIQLHLALKGWVERLLAVYQPQLTAEARYLCAAAGMGIVKGMITMIQPPDLIPLNVVIDEMVATLMAYVDTFAARHQTSYPADSG